MINLKNVFALSFLLLPVFGFNQIITQPVFTAHYGKNPKLHARGLASYKNELFIAASDGKMYVYDYVTKETSSSDSIGNIQYRDIIVKRKRLLLLASGDSSKTVARKLNKSKSKTTNFDNQFLDGIAFGKKIIFMMGDPIDGKFNLMFSKNFGKTWKPVKNRPEAKIGEAGFAASGTNVRMISDKEWLFVSGGIDSRLFRTLDAGKTWTNESMGFKSCESCGAYSFVVLPNNRIVAVGGDYTEPDVGEGTCRISRDGGKTWTSPKTNLSGYRSNVLFNSGVLYACGTNGIDVSLDMGETWQLFSNGNYFTMTIFANQLAASTINGTINFFDIAFLKP